MIHGPRIDAHGRSAIESDPEVPLEPQNLPAKASWAGPSDTYRKNQIVFSQGEPADSIFYLQKGEVTLTVLSEQGKEAIVAFLGAGDFFGEGCLTGQPVRMATAAAIEECVIVPLKKLAVTRFLHDEPEFSETFMAHLLARNVRMEADLVDQLFNSSEKCLARLLLILAKFGSEGKPEKVIAKVSQETLAGMIGTTRGRVSFFMNKFRKLGLVEYDFGHLKIHSSLLDIVLHDEPHIDNASVLNRISSSSGRKRRRDVRSIAKSRTSVAIRRS